MITIIKYLMSLGLVFFALLVNGQNETTKTVDQMPQFPGCQETDQKSQKRCSHEKLMAFIQNNLKYPKEVEGKEEGTVMVNFVVSSKGTIKDISIKRSLNKIFDNEGIRVVELMNKKGIRWIPGKKDGKPIDVALSLPLKFKME
ncbi:energy transducer TonB [Aureispira sp. CCB-E]|uniref:energy transducer TonB n=1 Tax=Aureispira sp. CCB-E TaxID=3051121 RepID=UPI00286965B1|nr:energy transducer TonB [Aureispira sp. CCB-E]WMX12482.1 energy transducer TonB [Aureispira sp. CCB-E]